VRIAYWTLLSVHVGFGLALLPLVVAHISTRFRLPRRADFERRRTALRYTVLLAAGAATYRLQQGINDLIGTPGANRRFTGSQPREGEGNGSFPITSWVADDPDRIDRDDYRLRVEGLVHDHIALTADELNAGHGTEAVLDCTSGWYTIQEWGGIRVGDLIEAAGGVTEGTAAASRTASRPTSGSPPSRDTAGASRSPRRRTRCSQPTSAASGSRTGTARPLGSSLPVAGGSSG